MLPHFHRIKFITRKILNPIKSNIFVPLAQMKTTNQKRGSTAFLPFWISKNSIIEADDLH